jgi:ankyrin repeat protein
LLGIDKEKRKHAIRLLQCLAFSRRPLRVNELAEVLATRFDAGQIPSLHKDQRSRKPDEDVLVAGSTLITTIKPGVHDDDVSDTRVIQFSHYSVVEFLTSERLASSKNEDLSQYFISPESAHTTLAQSCFGTLLQMDNHGKGVTQDFPLAEYAAQNWFHHAQYKDVAPRIQGGMNYLFDPSRKHFTVWVSVHNIDHVPSRSRLSKPSNPPEPSPLYYATLCGFRSVVEYLVITCRQDPNKSHGSRGMPLHAAVVSGHTAIIQFLLRHEHAADVNVRDKHNSTPLHEASGSGNLDVMRLLLRRGADVNVFDDRGDSPLHRALRYQRFDAVKLLVKEGADVNVRDKSNSTPLHEASGSGNLNVMQVLLNLGADINALDLWGDSALHKASRHQKVDAMKLLVKGSADVNVRDKSNSTPLHEASGSGNFDVMQLLLSFGADVNVFDHRGDSPLHKASRYQRFYAVKLLVKGGADVNVRDKSNSTPLHEASGSGNLDVVQLLLSLGADVNVLDLWGDSALHKASRYQKIQAVKLLVKGGADVNVRDKSNSTPLHEASGSRNLDIAQLLLTNGADVNVFDHWGDSPLHKSFRSSTFDIMGSPQKYCVNVNQGTYDKTLIRTTSSGENFNLVPPLSRKCTGAMNAQDKGRSTPVHDAPQGENYAMAQLLLAHGADVNVRGWRDKNPLDLASFAGSLDVTQLLIEHGADVNAQTPFSIKSARGYRKLTQVLLNHKILGTTMAGTSCVKMPAL